MDIKYDDIKLGDIAITVSYYNEREVGIVVEKAVTPLGCSITLSKRVDMEGSPCGETQRVYVSYTKKDGGEALALYEVAAIVGHIDL